MNIVVAVKVVPDDQDIQVTAEGGLDMSKAHQAISAYDMNAIEAAAQLAASAGDSTVSVVTVGAKAIDDSKLKKNILARGADHLYRVADDAAADLDAHATAACLAAQIASIGDCDVVICGDGSADNYAQQVDVQLAAKLGVPSVNGVVKLEANGSAITAERKLEDVVEVVEVPMPCVIAVSPDVALPRIPGMKDILQAGKKPMDVSAAGDIAAAAVETVEVKAPEAAERKLDVKDASEDGAIEAFAAAIKAAL
ncbi:MAG: electron transfer flavoprotein [Eggerthellaceae bacterium]|nr:electron transfer flavoprotein [Eggerthellaceae bacterium]